MLAPQYTPHTHRKPHSRRWSEGLRAGPPLEEDKAHGAVRQENMLAGIFVDSGRLVPALEGLVHGNLRITRKELNIEARIVVDPMHVIGTTAAKLLENDADGIY
eukprot:6222200-Amphidinium_carterae.3